MRPRTQRLAWSIAALGAALLGVVLITVGGTRTQRAPSSTASVFEATAAPAPGGAGDGLQIAFEVREIGGRFGTWYDAFLALPRVLPAHGDAAGARLQRESVFLMLNQLQADVSGNLIQAPKVTAFEGQAVTILHASSQGGRRLELTGRPGPDGLLLVETIVREIGPGAIRGNEPVRPEDVPQGMLRHQSLVDLRADETLAVWLDPVPAASNAPTAPRLGIVALWRDVFGSSEPVERPTRRGLLITPRRVELKGPEG